MGKNSRERVASSTPTPKADITEGDKKLAVSHLTGNNRLSIFPEWDDASLANERWDVQQKGGKSDRAARTPGTLFEDSDGLVQLPGKLKVETWRRPSDYLGDKVQTVVEDPEQNGRLNILKPNESLFKSSELLQAIITQISLLYKTETPCPPGLRTDANGDKTIVEGTDVWKPWHHIYPRSKAPNSFPIHSPSGKYAVKLFWMGCWRKIIVDDQIPFDKTGKMLIPQCANETELWMPILSKAILKIASLDYDSGFPDNEFGEVSVIHLLTGWLPEVIDVKKAGDEEIWNMIHSTIPQWTEDIQISEQASVASAEQSLTGAVGNGATSQPAMVFGTYDIKFAGDEPIGVPKINSEVGGTSFTGNPPPMVWLTETRRTAIPPPKPLPFLVAETGTQIKPTEALFQLRQQRQRRIKHELLLKQLAATTPRLIHATSAFANFEEVLGDYVPDMTTVKKTGGEKKKTDIGDKKDTKKKETGKAKKDGDGKGDKKKDDKKKNQSSDEKSEKAEKKKEKKKSPDQTETVTETETPVDDQEEEEEVVPISPLLSFWVEFLQFFNTFTKLYIFHKPSSYSCHRSVSDMRNIQPSCMVAQSGGRRTAVGGGQSGGLSSATCLRGIPPPSPLPATGNVPQHIHSQVQGQAGEDQPPLILCIDSTESIEMLISLSSLSWWTGAPLITAPTLGPIFTAKNKLGYTPGEVIEHNSNTDNENMIIIPGKLELSPFRWSNIRSSINTTLTLNSTATTCKRLTLPPGLHTLRLSSGAPYAWHSDFISNTPFVIADIDSYVSHINKESLRSQGNVLSLMKVISDNIEHFNEPETIAQTVSEIGVADKDRTSDKIFPDIKVFFEALFHMLNNDASDVLTTKHYEAWSAFSTVIIRSYMQGSGEDVTGIFENDLVPFRKPVDPDEVFNTENVEDMEERGADQREAASVIQKHFRGHHVRKRTKVLKKGTKVNLTTKQMLSESWAKIEGNELEHGLNVQNHMFVLKPALLDQYSFKEDREKSAYYIDYHGQHSEVPPRNWFLLFKEVFIASTLALVHVTVTSQITGLLLRVIDNDTGKEMPRICQKPIPCLFEPNKYGYTIMAEGKTQEAVLPVGKYRLRLVGSTPSLLSPVRDIATTSVTTQEVKEYYVQEKHNVMFRYVVHVSADSQTTVQVSTSKCDVNFRLEVLDCNEVIHSSEGRGHIVLPCVNFIADEDKLGSGKGRRTPVKTHPNIPEKLSKSDQKSLTDLQRKNSTQDIGPSAGIKSGTKSPKARPQVSQESDSEGARKKNHKFVIQATVLRNSWDNNVSPWQPIIDDIVPKDDQERPMSGSITEEKPSTPSRRKTLKEEKVDTKKGVKPGHGKVVSPAFDLSKPYWLLRVCTDSGTEDLTLKRDTQREDEIKSIKSAWEELQPGRANKSKALRAAYLMKKAEEEAKKRPAKEIAPEVPLEVPDVQVSLEEEEETSRVQSAVAVSTTVSDLVRADSPKFYEIPPAYTMYLKEGLGPPELFDEQRHAQAVERHRDKVEAFQQERRKVLTERDEDRAKRNELKEELLNSAENMQVEVETTREEILALRESLRQKMLAEEQARLAALEPDVVTTPSPKPTSAKKPKSPKGAKGKKK